MDAKSRETVIWLTLWCVVVAVRGYFLFRRPERRTSARLWLFWAFAAFGAVVVMVLAPIWAGTQPPLRVR